jgi:hypothetical protein
MAVRVRNGRYVIDYYPNGRSGKRVRITLPTGTSEGRARELEQEYRDRPFLFVVYDDTIGNVIGKFYEYVGLARTQSSVRSIQGSFDGSLGEYFKPLRVSELTPEQIEKYKELRLLEGARAATVNKELSYLSAFLRWSETRLNLHPKAALNIRKLHIRGFSRAANEEAPRLYILKNEFVASEQKLPFVYEDVPAPGVRDTDCLPSLAPPITDTPQITAAASSIVDASSMFDAPKTFNDDTQGKKVEFTDLVLARQKRVSAQSLQEEEPDAASGELSKYLVGSRKGANVSLAEMVRRTNISPRYFKALENQEFDKMPGGFFVEGYIREYMKALSIDPSEAVAIYNRLLDPTGEAAAFSLFPALPASPSRKIPRRLGYALMALMAIILIVMLFYGVTGIGGIVYEKYRAIMKVVLDTLVYGANARPV